MRTFAIASLGLAFTSLALAQEPTSLDGSPTSTVDHAATKVALQQFQQQQGSDWVVQWHAATGTPSTLYGTGIKLNDWRENSLEEARRHANIALTQYRDLLGLGSSDWTESIGARMGRTWSFKFDQSFRGVPVMHGRADVRINMKGVIAMLGSHAWQVPADFDTQPAIDAQVALATAWDALGVMPTGVAQPARQHEPRLVIWGDINAAQQAPFFLAWEVAVSNVDKDGQGPIGRYYVDAKTGGVLHYQNDKHECGMPGCTGGVAHESSSALPTPTTVTVMGWTRTGNDAYSALVNVPLPGIEITVAGVGNFVTDANGQFSMDLAATTNVTIGNLNGRHHSTLVGPNAPTATVPVSPGVPTTIQLSSSGASTNEAAHTTTSWWVDGANEWIRTILGNSAQMNTASAITPTVNIASTCNAYYTNNTINFYAAGGSCANTAFSTVVVHEWGHGLDDRYGGISNASGDGLSEGWGDIIGLYMVDSPILGSGFQTAGVGIRNGNNTKMYGTQTEVHAAGEIWMGFAWRFRENLRANYGTTVARQISDDVVISSIVADATNQADAVTQVFIADDDDGNLLNGVPHYAELSAAAIAKGMPYPQVQLVSVIHTPLTNTNQRLVPRDVYANIAPVSGSVVAQRIVFTPPSGPAVTRNMHPTGVGDQYIAMLPGLSTGAMSYHLEVVHSGGTVIRRPETGEYTYAMIGANYSTFYTEDFETGAAGWTHGASAGTDEWQVGSPTGRSGTSSGVFWQDPAAAAVGSSCYGVDLGNGTNGRYIANTNSFLRSPTINCSGHQGVRLRFRRWLSVEEAIYDHAQILVNGVLVWENNLNGNTQDTAWQQIDLPIPTADNNPSVQLEWRLITDGGLQMGGWHIDQVEVVETVVPTQDCDLTFLPEQAVQGTSLTMTIETPGNSRPFMIALGDSIGPTIIPGFPTIFVGGNAIAVAGSTDASGFATFNVLAPTVPSINAVRFYSQVLTLDAGFTQFVVSNRHINLFTQTP